MAPNQLHLWKTNAILLVSIFLISIMGNNRQDVASQTLKVYRPTFNPSINNKSNVISIINNEVLKKDSIIKIKMDSLEMNSEKILQGTENSKKITEVILKNISELKKQSKKLDETINILKHDSIVEADREKLNIIKKKNYDIRSDTLQFPIINQPKIKKKGLFKRIFGL